jgi:hypothetical protein
VTGTSARRSAAPRLVVDPRVRNALLAAAAGLLALWIAGASGVHKAPASGILDSVQAAARAVAAALLLFFVSGFGLTRLLLPRELARYELLWIPAVGAAAAGLFMTVLGFAWVPFKVSLALTLAAGVALGALATRRRGRDAPPLRGLGWPGLVAGLLVCVALAPYFGAGFPTVTGFGSDAFHAVGAADFLQHNHPTAVNANGPLDQMPPLWRSKQPIYYALGAVASLAHLEPYQTLAPVAALVIVLASVGVFLFARELLGGSFTASVMAMAITGLDAMVLKTALNPYFNQTWGYFALPFSLVLAWWTVSRRSAGAAALLVLFLLLGAFAYPLALPIPALALAVFFALDVRERRRRGQPTGMEGLRSFARGRSLLWLVPLGLALALPAAAAGGKIWSAASLLLDPNSSLRNWGGDLRAFIPAHEFFALGTSTLWWLAVAVMVLLALWLLRGLPRPLGWGLGVTLAAFLLAGLWFRQRDFGWYFEFKTLVFAAPLLVACAVVAASRLGRFAVPLLALFLLSAHVSAREEVRSEKYQLTKQELELRGWSRGLPRDASIRLDTWPPIQLWGSYMLSRQPLCSRLPLLGTDYPHVLVSRRADYILEDSRARRLSRGRPPDALGPPLRANSEFRLYRARPGLPGPDRCSRRLVYH